MSKTNTNTTTKATETKATVNDARHNAISQLVDDLSKSNKNADITIELSTRKNEDFCKLKLNSNIVACIYYSKNNLTMFASTNCENIEFTFYAQNSARPKYKSNAVYTDAKSVNKDLQLVINKMLADAKTKEAKKSEKTNAKAEAKTDTKKTVKKTNTDNTVTKKNTNKTVKTVANKSKTENKQ